MSGGVRGLALSVNPYVPLSISSSSSSSSSSFLLLILFSFFSFFSLRCWSFCVLHAEILYVIVITFLKGVAVPPDIPPHNI